MPEDDANDRRADALSVGRDAEPSGRPARSIYSLLASAWFYGGWKAETKTERDMQAIMEAEGWWPIRGEGDLFTRIGKEMLSASPPTPAEPGWQPISSAPRDGTTILVAHSSNGAMFTVGWDDRAAGWANGATDNYDDLVTYSPSHWMPLPTPPVEAPSPAHAELSPGNSSDLRGEEG